MKRTKAALLILVLAMCLPTLAACTADAPDETPTDTVGSIHESTAPPTSESTAPDTTQPEQTTAAQEEKGFMQIIPDLTFQDGIDLISQKDHNNGDEFSVLDSHSFYGGETDMPVWRLAQLDSGPCFVENRIPSDPTIITDGMGRSFGYDPEQNVMTIELDTALYYHGKPAVQGDYWPHLLVEQANFTQSITSSKDKKYLSCDVDRLVLSMDIRKATGRKSIMLDAERVSGRTACDAMRAGDEAGKEVYDKYVKYLASGLATIINIFQPEIISLGGGVSNEGQSLIDALLPIVRAEQYGGGLVPLTEIRIAKLGNDAGIIGAAMLG